ncbi:MAG TPA: universal stress protein [Candidatus Binatia bacterium]|nr:universal stress protein [Candidatus Binatia bacterium]
MYRQILVPLDGSETAEKVLPYARILAATLKNSVELMGVIDISTQLEKVRYLDTLIDEGVRRSREYLERVAKTFPGASVKCTVEKGRPEEVIIVKAAGEKDTLVAMASHGRSGINRWLLGSISEKVLRVATNPVLVVRANEQGSAEGEAAPDSMIVPLDGSELAESVLPHVVELTKAFNSKVTLLRSYSLKQMIYRVEDYTPDLDELKHELQWEAMSYLDDKVSQLNGAGLVHVFPFVTEGDAAETIIELAKGAPNSWIAMCTHGRSGVKRWVLGSVTEKVVRHSGNPVLAIRAKEAHG